MKARHSIQAFAVMALVLVQIGAIPDARAASTATNALVSTISASRQFAVYANNQLLPSALCVYAEHVKREWLRQMDTSDSWRDPILLVVRTRELSQTNTPAISMAVYQTDTHLKYQIRCLIPPLLDETELLATMVDALSSEWANREQPLVRGKLYVAPAIPLWLVEGLAASIQGRFDSLLAVARRSVAAGRPQQASDLLETKVLPSDAADRQLFQANAWMLTESLLAMPDGSQKLRKFLTELGAQKVASTAFWSVYHQEFSADIPLEKWWSLEQARRTSVTVAQDLSAEDTLRQLKSILVVKLEPTNEYKRKPAETETTLDKLWQYEDEPWMKDVLKLKISELGALRSQAHPFYQPVLDEYLDASKWLFQDNAVRFRRAVREAVAMQAAAEKRSRAVSAYLDQDERAYTPEEFTQEFKDCFQTLDQAQKLQGERSSPITDYLDKFDH